MQSTRCDRIDHKKRSEISERFYFIDYNFENKIIFLFQEDIAP